MKQSDAPITYASLLQDQAFVFYGLVSEFRAADCLAVLSEKEITRASKYLNGSDRNRYIISRAILKKLTARFLQVNEQDIEFNYGENGKPFLRADPELQFNASHTGDVFAIGFVHGKKIGIDVEDRSRPFDLSRLQSYLFTPAESEQFHRLPHNHRQEAFLSCWTKKEALLKASGEGLTKPMNTMDLSLIEKEQNDTDWFLERFTFMENYLGAVAVKGCVAAVQYISVSESHRLLKDPVE